MSPWKPALLAPHVIAFSMAPGVSHDKRSVWACIQSQEPGGLCLVGFNCGYCPAGACRRSLLHRGALGLRSDGRESLQKDTFVDVFVLFPEAALQTFTALLHTFQSQLTHVTRPNESNSCPQFPSPPYLPKKLMGCEYRNRK